MSVPVGSTRDLVIADLVATILAVDPAGEHRTRVCVDGITAAGKTTLASELGGALEARGRSVLRITMDGFHHSRAHRYRQGRGSAAGYYVDAYDLDALRSLVLEPLGCGETRVRTAIIDLATDTPVTDAWADLPRGGVLIVDGTFLQRGELVDAWDLRICIAPAFAVARERGAARDAELLGGVDAARAAFDARYHAACRRYIAEVDPESRCDVLVDNADPTNPAILRTR